MKENYYFPPHDPLLRNERLYRQLVLSTDVHKLLLKNRDEWWAKSLVNIFVHQGIYPEEQLTELPQNGLPQYVSFVNDFYKNGKLTISDLSTIMMYYSIDEIMEYIVANDFKDPRFLMTQMLSEFPYWLYMYSYENTDESYIHFKRGIKNLITKEKTNLPKDTHSIIAYFKSYLKKMILTDKYNPEMNKDAYIYFSSILTAGLLIHLSLIYIKIDNNNKHILYFCIKDIINLLIS